MDKQYEALPEVFRNRIDRFRSNNPSFRWEHERYELFVCEEAVDLANHIPNPDELKKFFDLPHEEQIKIHPNLSNNHSGNTFGATCSLAYLYLTNPDAVELGHGALCSLVGCKNYGCVSKVNVIEKWLEGK